MSIRAAHNPIRTAALSPAGDAPVSQALLKLTPTERFTIFACLGSAIVAFLLPFPETKYALGAFLAAVFVRASLRDFYIAVGLFAFFLPLQALLPQDSFLIRGLNVQTLMVLYFVGLAVIASTSGRYPATDRPVPGGRQVLFLVAIILLSSVHSASISDESFGDLFARIKNWFIYAAFLWLTYRFVRTPREKLFVLLFVFLVTILSALQSLRSVFMDQGLGLNLPRHRAISLIVDQPNLWAGFLAMYLFFFIAFLVYFPLSKWQRIFFLGATFVVALNLIYTMSRGAWLATLAALTIVVLLKSRRLILPVIVIAVGMYFFLPDIAVDRFQSGFTGEYNPELLTKDNIEAEEAASRIIQWRTFLPMLANDPIVGVGFGRYPEVFFKSGHGDKLRSAHSTIIEIAVENGVIGLFAYLLLLGTFYRQASLVLARSSEPIDKVLALGIIGATVCLFFLDVTGTRFRNGNIMALYWVLGGMAFSGASQLPATATEPSVAQPSSVAVPVTPMRRRRGLGH